WMTAPARSRLAGSSRHTPNHAHGHYLSEGETAELASRRFLRHRTSTTVRTSGRTVAWLRSYRASPSTCRAGRPRRRRCEVRWSVSRGAVPPLRATPEADLARQVSSGLTGAPPAQSAGRFPARGSQGGIKVHPVKGVFHVSFS